MLKSKMMKKAVTVVSAAAIMALAIGCGCAQEETKQNTPTNVVVTTPADQQTVPEDQIPVDQPTTTDPADATEKPTGTTEGEGGGNEYKNDSETIVYEFDVLISESEYIYENSPISLDDLIKTIQDTEGDKLVVITENNASQNAFEALTDKLNELEIPFEEKHN